MGERQLSTKDVWKTHRKIKRYMSLLIYQYNSAYLELPYMRYNTIVRGHIAI